MGTNNVLTGAYRPDAAAGGAIICDGLTMRGTWRDSEAPRDPADIRAAIRMEAISVSAESRPGSEAFDVEGCIYLGDKWEYRLTRGQLRLRAQGAAELPTSVAHCTLPPASTWLFNP